MRLFIRLLAAAGIAAAIALPARAAVLYSEPMATPSSSWFGIASETGNQVLASSFTVTGSGTVSATGAEWIGLPWLDWPQPPTFTIQILDSVTGTGNVLASRTATATATDTGLDNSEGWDVFSYAASFAAIELQAGTEYYFSVASDYGLWLWGDGTGSGLYYGSPSSGWEGFLEDAPRAFTLLGDGAETTTVAEPPAAALFGLMLIGAGLRRRMRRNPAV
ncbi:MAG: hypothetical protein GEU92_13875 [Alphaproteobacteria bacterium]|nr:hypothetical protein [Alphaproteobacteria bacterium]